MTSTVAIPTLVAGWLLLAAAVASLTALVKLFTLGGEGKSSKHVVAATILVMVGLCVDVYVTVTLAKAIF